MHRLEIQRSESDRIQQEFLDKQLSHALAEVGEFKKSGSSCCKRMMAWNAISRRSKI